MGKHGQVPSPKFIPPSKDGDGWLIPGCAGKSSAQMLGGSRLQDGGSEGAKAPLHWRKVMLGKLEKVKCSVMGHLTTDLVGTPSPALCQRC